MTAHRAPLTNHHADGSTCPPAHKHTVTGKPLHPDCPGRDHSRAVCTCGDWQFQCAVKGQVLEHRRRHLATHQAPALAPGPLVRDVLPFSMR
ncbi:hypothetical protein ACFVT9_28310 [Kitasatospora cineracea]|uniref:hypothetical protein n=1 Tax=Kitasatospora cineracea TaxID=88074 RepID=UPI0036DD60CC